METQRKCLCLRIMIDVGYNTYYFSSGNCISLPPTDTTVFPDDDASFSCLTQGRSTPYWRLNGTDYDNLPSAVHDDIMVVTKTGVYVQSTNITITARAEYNETRVGTIDLVTHYIIFIHVHKFAYF